MLPYNEWAATRPAWIGPRKTQIAQAQHVIIGGSIMLYKDKAPYVPSGVSIAGALEYRASDDKIKCHECGKWLSSMGAHLTKTHGMNAKEYKAKHGLRAKSSLCGDRMRQIAIRNITRQNYINGGTPLTRNPESRIVATAAMALAARRPKTVEMRNTEGSCQAQIMSKFKALAVDLGRTPTVKDLEREGLQVGKVKYALNVATLEQAARLCGMQPNQKKSKGDVLWPKPLLVASLSAFAHTYKRLPSMSDTRRGLTPPYTAILREFGGLQGMRDQLAYLVAA